MEGASDRSGEVVKEKQGEFWEYNQKNDQLSVPIDCVPGKGTITGTKEKPIHADLALAPITILYLPGTSFHA